MTGNATVFFSVWHYINVWNLHQRVDAESDILSLGCEVMRNG